MGEFNSNAVDEFAESIFRALSENEELQPLENHRFELLSIATQLIIYAVTLNSPSLDYQHYLIKHMANHVFGLRERLGIVAPPDVLLH